MNTRTAILEKNFEAIRQDGFQGTRTDKVIATLGITKGAFYHYFPTKLAMGYAIVEEILAPAYIEKWTHLADYKGHPIDGIVEGIELIRRPISQKNIYLGCPLNNLVQEMSAIDQVFREKLSAIITTSISLIEQCIGRGQQASQISSKVKARSLAHFIFASIEGSFSMGKAQNSFEVFNMSIDSLISYLKSLKE
ncbi:MAG: TetR/AcrR family transcriptional regulator [Thermonemataceae bacterium]